ncbi:MAG: hypothetical protein EOP09_18225 [Proteobacteria bacterium]|nr:MAG: hypothetical protein EOP09_18225 [Pseudomonadota bacterium]
MTESICRFTFPFIAALSSFIGTAQAATTFQLRVGEQKIFRFGPIQKYSTGGTAIRVKRIQSKNADEELLVKGSLSGFSDLNVWLRDGSERHFAFEVRPSDTRRAAEVPELRTWLQSLNGVDYSFLSSQDAKSPALLSGEVNDLTKLLCSA